MGIAKASFVKPDIVLMDINLPDTNGLAAAKIIKDEHPDCDLIILTTFDVAAFRKAAEKLKVQDFIGKHDVYDCLLPAIKKCLEHSSHR
jgi:two-component system response regulator YesN